MATSQKPHSGPRDVFSYLLVFSTLYASVVSYLTLLFQYVNFRFPDPLNYFPLSILNSIRLASSFLLVAWPVYLLMNFLLSREIRKQPEQRNVGIRKWLTYLTLFVAAVTLMGDMISLVYNFYSGGLSIRFGLKILSVLVVGGIVFGYYLWNLHTKNAEKTRIPRVSAIIASLVILLTILAGFFLVGSPAEQRKIRFDDQRVNDLQNIQSQIENYYATYGALPAKLSDLTDAPYNFVIPTDPATNSQYEYKKSATNAKSYELCAIFETSSPSDISVKTSVVRSVNENWNHVKVGAYCFPRTVTSIAPIKTVD